MAGAVVCGVLALGLVASGVVGWRTGEHLDARASRSIAETGRVLAESALSARTSAVLDTLELSVGMLRKRATTDHGALPWTTDHALRGLRDHDWRGAGVSLVGFRSTGDGGWVMAGDGSLLPTDWPGVEGAAVASGGAQQQVGVVCARRCVHYGMRTVDYGADRMTLLAVIEPSGALAPLKDAWPMQAMLLSASERSPTLLSARMGLPRDLLEHHAGGDVWKWLNGLAGSAEDPIEYRRDGELWQMRPFETTAAGEGGLLLVSQRVSEVQRAGPIGHFGWLLMVLAGLVLAAVSGWVWRLGRKAAIEAPAPTPVQPQPPGPERSVYFERVANLLKQAATPVVHGAQLIAEARAGETRETLAQEVAQAGGRLRSAVDGAVDFLELEAGTPRNEPHDADPVQVAVHLFQQAQAVASQPQRLRMVIAQSAARPVRLDAAKLSRALQHLLAEGLGAADGAPVLMVADLETDRVPAPMLCVRIEDRVGSAPLSLGSHVAEGLIQCLGGTLRRETDETGLRCTHVQVPVEPVAGPTGAAAETGEQPPPLLLWSPDAALRERLVAATAGMSGARVAELRPVEVSAEVRVLAGEPALFRPDASVPGGTDQLGLASMLVSDGGRLPGGADLRPGLYVRIDPEADVDQLRDSVAIAERLAAHEALLSGFDLTTRSGARRVVVADDQPAILTWLARLLRARGHVVELFEEGASAQKALLSERYDVAILDEDMPGARGSEIIAAARQHSLPTRLVIFSAEKPDPTVGADLWVEKPGQPKVLIAAVESQSSRGAVPLMKPPGVDALVSDNIEWEELAEVYPSDAHDFVDNLIDIMNRLESAGKDGDDERLRRAMHAMKGVAGMYGFGALHSNADVIAKAGRPEGTHYQPLVVYAQQAREILAEVHKEIPPEVPMYDDEEDPQT